MNAITLIAIKLFATSLVVVVLATFYEQAFPKRFSTAIIGVVSSVVMGISFLVAVWSFQP